MSDGRGGTRAAPVDLSVHKPTRKEKYSRVSKPKLAITMGDVNGVGPEILAKTLAKDSVWNDCQPVVIGDPGVLDDARRFAPDCPEPRLIGDIAEAGSARTHVPVLDAGVAAPELQSGTLDPEAGNAAVQWCRLAVQLTLDGAVAGLVTCPFNKQGIHLAGHAYPGHTEIIAEMTKAADYRMCLFTDSMRVVHITSHAALREAIDMVHADRIITSIRLGHEALVNLGLERKRIAVAALNPHAGEYGAFGLEEVIEIAPAVQTCQALGIDCSGPHPADTLFLRMRDGEFDMVVAMYHDQGHIPVKLIAMDQGVNVTLGIPIIRTSVDHGTAYDIAGKGIAREDSLCAAIRLAARFTRNRGT